MKLVDCIYCASWTDEKRFNKGNLCEMCNNSKKMQAPETILCNLCGGYLCSLTKDNASNETWGDYPHGLRTKIEGGYTSEHLSDLTTYRFNLCEKCLREMFIQCKIKPTLTGILDSEITWEQDQKDYEYNQWVKNGGNHQAYLEQKCNAIKNCPNKADYTILYDGEFSEDCVCEEHTQNNSFNVGTTIVRFMPDHLKSFF